MKTFKEGQEDDGRSGQPKKHKGRNVQMWTKCKLLYAQIECVNDGRRN